MTIEVLDDRVIMIFFLYSYRTPTILDIGPSSRWTHALARWDPSVGELEWWAAVEGRGCDWTGTPIEDVATRVLLVRLNKVLIVVLLVATAPEVPVIPSQFAREVAAAMLEMERTRHEEIRIQREATSARFRDDFAPDLVNTEAKKCKRVEPKREQRKELKGNWESRQNVSGNQFYYLGKSHFYKLSARENTHSGVGSVQQQSSGHTSIISKGTNNRGTNLNSRVSQSLLSEDLEWREGMLYCIQAVFRTERGTCAESGSAGKVYAFEQQRFISD
ncbi:hypothetical protein Acr_18g0006660 [Actinidia rufa]|uniref:Uncharacterized protein n=1 Tax=Actinidia rufa TaxID=165716 RepID=A0A7J0G6T7_9ERIC|nr:hypothetical protein Acr_18g0006660 [Actinidia rufa]